MLNLQGEPLELYEAYLRLENNGELLSPTAFLGIAEEHGLLADINRWVVSQAIAVLGQRAREGNATQVLVKVTPESFEDPQMIATLRRELQAQGVPGERLWLHAPRRFHPPAQCAAVPSRSGAAGLPHRPGAVRFGAGFIPAAGPLPAAVPRWTGASPATWPPRARTSTASARSPRAHRKRVSAPLPSSSAMPTR